MRRTILLATVMLLTTLALPAVAATYGTPDGAAHPYVVLLTFYADAGDGVLDTNPVWDDEDDVWRYPDDYQWRCTGTVLDEDTILTAGHCVHGTPYQPDGTPADEPQDMEVAHVYVGYADTTVHPALTFHPDDPNLPDDSNTYQYVTGTPIPNGDYNDAWTDFPDTHDYAVVKLNVPLSDVGSLGTLPVLADVGTLDGMSQRELRGLVFETVGYGLQWTRGPWRYQGDWVRYRAQSTLINLRSANNGGYSVQTTNNKGRYEGGSCFGDSGGPVFLHEGDEHLDQHVIIGIVSWGYSPNCTGADWSYRADREEVHAFVDEYLEPTDD